MTAQQGPFDLVRVTWVDAHNNQGAWMSGDELVAFAADEAYRVTQVGYKVHEDELCIVLAARLSTPSPDYGQSFGMCERIPRKLIDSMTVLEAVGSPADPMEQLKRHPFSAYV
ncbi:MAG TPA: hypothetical protein VK537_07545 [Galbitalea sp.]|nr:hypothetical protein [Galbitalea sp.]